MKSDTPTQRFLRLFAILIALMLLGMFYEVGCTAHAGEFKRLRKETRITVLRPVRAQGRAAAHYPFLQTTANCTRIVANVTGLFNPLGWILR